MPAGRVLGRYALYDEIAHGGMATVHFGRHTGAVGFARTVAIKRLHPQFAKDPDFASMFIDEARLAARIRHPNVVPTLDVVAEDDELFLVMEYVPGESLSRLLRVLRNKGRRIPLDVLSAIMVGALHGLHAAHEATSETGQPLSIVHRDVSPQNILVGADGVPRVLDFGIAKAAGRLQTTKEGQLKGKLAYMPPEQVQGAATRRTDVYAIAVCIWEALVGERLFYDENPAFLLHQILNKEVVPPSRQNDTVPPALDELVLKGLARDPRERFATAREMARELERVVRPASASEVGDWVESIIGDDLSKRTRTIAEIESASSKQAPLEVPQPIRTSAEPVTRVGSLTEQSSISLATPSAHERAAQRRSPALTLALFAIAGLVGLVAFLMMRAQPAPTPAAVNATPHASPSVSVSASASAAPVETAASEAAPIPTLNVTKTPAPSSSVVPQKTKVKVTKPAANCNPPFEYDSNGKKRYKPECF